MQTKTDKYEIISLGTNCLPRTVLTRGNVKPSKNDGELSCPFDLVSHPIENIVRYLETNFNDYFDDLFFKIRKRNFFDFRKKGLWQKMDGTKFFHDKDCKSCDKEKLILRIKNRIKNFYKIIESDTPILFVLYIKEKSEYINEIFNTLQKLCSHKHFELAIIDFNNSVDLKKNNSFYLLKLPKPIKTFNTDWNTTKYRNSELGVYIEKCICDFIKEILDKDFYY